MNTKTNKTKKLEKSTPKRENTRVVKLIDACQLSVYLGEGSKIAPLVAAQIVFEDEQGNEYAAICKPVLLPSSNFTRWLFALTGSASMDEVRANYLDKAGLILHEKIIQMGKKYLISVYETRYNHEGKRLIKDIEALETTNNE